MGASIGRLYVTPEEARELHAELEKAFERLVGEHHRFGARWDPKLRPPDAVWPRAGPDVAASGS